MAMISCSNHDDRTEEFHFPFSRSATYLGMNYLGDIHTWVEKQVIPEEVKDKMNAFAFKIRE